MSILVSGSHWMKILSLALSLLYIFIYLCPCQFVSDLSFPLPSFIFPLERLYFFFSRKNCETVFCSNIFEDGGQEQLWGQTRISSEKLLRLICRFTEMENDLSNKYLRCSCSKLFISFMSECFYFWLSNRKKKLFDNWKMTNKSNDMEWLCQNTRSEYVTKIQILGLMQSDVRIS